MVQGIKQIGSASAWSVATGRTVYEGMPTPWGAADYAAPICPGIGVVGTPRHGGIKVSAELNARIPDYMRDAEGWYEEDCSWSVVFVVLEKELLASGDLTTVATIESGRHAETLRHWSPQEAARYFEGERAQN